MIEGRWAPIKGSHPHRMREVSRTLDGPLITITSCADCGKTEVIKPSRRMRKVREGYSEVTWAALLGEADARKETN